MKKREIGFNFKDKDYSYGQGDFMNLYDNWFIDKFSELMGQIEADAMLHNDLDGFYGELILHNIELDIKRLCFQFGMFCIERYQAQNAYKIEKARQEEMMRAYHEKA